MEFARFGFVPTTIPLLEDYNIKTTNCDLVLNCNLILSNVSPLTNTSWTSCPNHCFNIWRCYRYRKMYRFCLIWSNCSGLSPMPSCRCKWHLPNPELKSKDSFLVASHSEITLFVNTSARFAYCKPNNCKWHLHHPNRQPKNSFLATFRSESTFAVSPPRDPSYKPNSTFVVSPPRDLSCNPNNSMLSRPVITINLARVGE